MNNKIVGNTFEQQLCRELSSHGYWVHNLAQNRQGQPFDVIAARNGKVYPIDCKVCQKDVFRLDRIEENQRLAMMLWRETGNGDGWFALKLSDDTVWFLSLSEMEKYTLAKSELSLTDIKSRGWRPYQWAMWNGQVGEY